VRPDVVVVGGGLVGLSVALAARGRGMEVLLLERESVGRHASSASAGGVRSLNRHPAEIPLARAALPLWDELALRLGRDVGFRRSGQVRVAEDAAALEALEARAARVHALGHEHERMIGRRALARRIPALAPHCLGALVVDDDGFADPLAAIHGHREAALREGVAIREGVAVRALDGRAALTDQGEIAAGAVVNAAGAWGGALAPEEVPIRTAALQMTVTAPVAPFVEPVLGTEGRRLSLKQSAAGAVVIGGGHEGRVDEAARRGRPDPTLAARNLAAAVSLFPHLAEARILRMWTGLEGMVADGLPVLGPSRQAPGLVHAFGFSAHGFALAPLVGPLVADMLEGRATNLPVAPFAPDRFETAGMAA
jgi:sarcosine oxidase subunit beta